MTDGQRPDIMTKERREMIRVKLLKIAAPQKEFFKFTVDDDGKVYYKGKLADDFDLEQFDEILLVRYKPITPQLRERRKEAKAYKQAQIKALLEFLDKNDTEDIEVISYELDIRYVRVWRLLRELEDLNEYDYTKITIEDDPPYRLRLK